MFRSRIDSHRNEYKTMKSVQLKEPEFLSGAPGSPVCTAVGDALSWVLSPPSPAPGLPIQVMSFSPPLPDAFSSMSDHSRLPEAGFLSPPTCFWALLSPFPFLSPSGPDLYELLSLLCPAQPRLTHSHPTTPDQQVPPGSVPPDPLLLAVHFCRDILIRPHIQLT